LVNDLFINIGSKIKQIRQGNNYTLTEIATKAGVSKGLISKIENGRAIPSLPVLFRIIKALTIDLSVFFEGISDFPSNGYIHRKASEYVPVEKEDSQGFSYFSIINESFDNISFQTSVLKLAPGAVREKVVTDGYTFLYVIDGYIDYLLDTDFIKLTTGDSLFFDGKIPHVPKNNNTQPATILIVYLLNT